MSAVIPTIDVIPITTPRTVSPERILLPRTVSRAMLTTSGRSVKRTISFPPQGLNRIEARRPHRRIQAEEQSDERRDADAERDRPCFDRRGDRREPRDGQRDGDAQDR